MDLLEISLEHHRAGRLQAAEAGYRRVIEAEPGRAEGHHWLGVLLLQAGQAAEAVPLLEKAATLAPGDAASAYNLGQAYLAVRLPAEAAAAFGAAVSIDPKRGESWLGLGTALLGRHNEGDAELAAHSLREAKAAGLDSAELHRQLATALLGSNQIDEAIEHCAAAIQKDPKDASGYYRMALACRAKGDGKGVRKNLLKSLEIEPAFAQGWYGLGMLDFEEGKLPQATGLLRRALAARPHFPAASQALAEILQKLGYPDDATAVLRQAEQAAHAIAQKTSSGSIEALEQKIAPDKKSLELHYALAALTNVMPPATVPTEAVAGLFDKYADTFDEHLVGKLHYQAPELIATALLKDNAKFGDALDLGCGTGLVGPLLRPHVRSLVGVDLSAGMLDKARERNLYDRLEVADLAAYMRAHPGEFDLLVAADVLLYIGDLLPTFEAAMTCLRPGGTFAFTLEAGGGERYDLTLKTRRYRHSKPYVEKLIGMFGWTQEKFEVVALRSEAEKPVAGWLVVLRKT